MQVDERHLEYLSKLRNGSGTQRPAGRSPTPTRTPTPGPTPSPPSTPNDEMAFMAADTGGAAYRGAPADPARGHRRPRGPGHGHRPAGHRRLHPRHRARASCTSSGARGRADARRRPGLRPLRLPAQRPDGPRRGLHDLERSLLDPLLGPLDPRPAGHRRRPGHPRPSPEPLRRRVLRAERGHLLRRRRRATPPTSTVPCGRSAPTSGPTAAPTPSASTCSTGAPSASRRSCGCTRSRGSSTSTTTAPPPSACSTRARPPPAG